MSVRVPACLEMHTLTRTKAKPARLNSVGMHALIQRDTATSNVFAGSKTIASLLQRGIIRQEQIEARLKMLPETAQGCKRPSATCKAESDMRRHKCTKAEPLNSSSASTGFNLGSSSKRKGNSREASCAQRAHHTTDNGSPSKRSKSSLA